MLAFGFPAFWSFQRVLSFSPSQAIGVFISMLEILYLNNVRIDFSRAFAVQ